MSVRPSFTACSPGFFLSVLFPRPRLAGWLLGTADFRVARGAGGWCRGLEPRLDWLAGKQTQPPAMNCIGPSQVPPPVHLFPPLQLQLELQPSLIARNEKCEEPVSPANSPARPTQRSILSLLWPLSQSIFIITLFNCIWLLHWASKCSVVNLSPGTVLPIARPSCV